MFIIKKLWNKIKKLPRKAERLLGILGEILWILFQKAGRILKKGLQKIPRNPIVVVIGVIIIYLIVTAGLYFSSEQIESYQVTSGTLEKNPVYTALAIREEKVVNASQDGYLRYLRKEGSNVEKNGNVYAVGDSEIQIAKYALDETQKSKIKNAAEAFSGTFDSSDFADTYSLKYELNGMILQTDKAEQTEDTSDEEEYDENGFLVVKGNTSIMLGNQTVVTSPDAGIVMYTMDGYEGKTVDNLKKSDFAQKSYTEKSLISTEAKEDTPVYKLITDETWNLMIPVSKKEASKLSEGTIQVKFLKDKKTQNGQLSIVDIDGQKVAKITLKNGMVRYASERFLKVELVIHTKTGLKIPLSSIVDKKFYIIPSDYLAKEVQDGVEREGFYRITKDDKGKEKKTFVVPAIYKNTADSLDKSTSTVIKKIDYCYVDMQTFQEGDVVQKPDSSETFTVGEPEYLSGAYCINRGYAMFRCIEQISGEQNEESCLIKKNTAYGLSEYDRIVKNGSSVKEDEILTGKQGE